MKRTFIFLLSILFSVQAFAQKTEYSVQIASGFFSFRGPDARNSTVYIVGTDQTGYTSNPYGRESGFSYGIALQVQRVTKWHFIYGLQAGYESSSGKIKIDNIPLYYNPNSSAVYPDILTVTEGSRAILTNQFIDLHPFIGTRIDIISSIKTDLTFGAGFGFCTRSEEKDILHTSAANYNRKLKRVRPKVDSRLRVDMVNYYKRTGLDIGYSYGLTNYEAGMIPGGKVYSQMLKLGLVFKL